MIGGGGRGPGFGVNHLRPDRERAGGGGSPRDCRVVPTGRRRIRSPADRSPFDKCNNCLKFLLKKLND